MTTGSGGPTNPTVLSVRHFTRGVEIDFSIPEDLFFLQGHFPGRPILPGVVQVDWAVQLADRFLQTGIGGARQFKVKFKSLIAPGSDFLICLQKSADDRHLNFEYRQHSNVLSSGSIRLKTGR